jgi:cytochrome d ubiquinol oxidase subunit I
MNTLSAARAQMEVSLGFHMIFAALGIGMPLLMLLAEGLQLRTGRPHYGRLARMWGKATAVLFAIGAVSGTVLSFELGLLWPRFMRVAGPVVGPAFALEGYAFFVEAIFVGLYLFGWDRLSPRVHLLAGVPVAVSGMISGVIVLAANAWMQHPVGFALVAGRPADIHPAAVFTNPSYFTLALHSTLSCYIATGFATAGVYAAGLLRGRSDTYHRSAVGIALGMATVAAVLQLASGDLSARNLATRQPMKLAAVEAHYDTSSDVPLLIGGLPDTSHETVRYALRVPSGLSLLAFHDPHAVVRGLHEVPAANRPNVVVCHIAFQVMVGCGFGLIAIGGAYWLARWRRRGELPRAIVLGVALGSPLGFIALEAGWLVTEAGRQPWVIYGLMRTRDAVTSADGVPTVYFTFSALYLALAVAVVALLMFLARHGREREMAVAPPPARVE